MANYQLGKFTRLSIQTATHVTNFSQKVGKSCQWLQAISQSDALSSGLSESDAAVDTYYELLDPEYRPMVRHALLSGANVTNDQMNYQVNCSLDAQLRVEIVVNVRTDLCMLAFVEEFSGLVGQDNLFKRSLLLIRAWWVYETASYVGTTCRTSRCASWCARSSTSTTRRSAVRCRCCVCS